MSEASKIIAYIGQIVTSHVGTLLDLTDLSKTIYLLNVDEASANVDPSFILADEKLPYVQIVMPIAKSIAKTKNLEQVGTDTLIQIFFRLPSNILMRSLEAQQYKQDVAFELRQILDQLERTQISDPLAPDFWIDGNAQISIEKSTLYSVPDEQSPVWMASANFTINFDEEYQ